MWISNLPNLSQEIIATKIGEKQKFNACKTNQVFGGNGYTRAINYVHKFFENYFLGSYVNFA